MARSAARFVNRRFLRFFYALVWETIFLLRQTRPRTFFSFPLFAVILAILVAALRGLCIQRFLPLAFKHLYRTQEYVYYLRPFSSFFTYSW